MLISATLIQALALAAMTAVGSAAGQQPKPPAPAASSQVRETEAIDALTRMGKYLRTLQSFQVRVAYTTEDVRDDGQKIQIAGVTDMLVGGPSRIRANVVNDRHERSYLYDGKTFTLFARRANYYATVPAPPTSAALIDVLEQKYEIELPLIDLFRWGSERWASAITDIKAARDVGPSQVSEITCQHYAYRQDGLDWQIWIQLGDFPLPRKLVLTTTTDEARPQYSATYDWNLAPSFNDAAFAFDPPPGAQRIVIAEVSAAQ
jgi:hypothetical protein